MFYADFMVCCEQRATLKTGSGGGVMWFKVENKRSSTGQKYTVRCNADIAGRGIVEERLVKGMIAARKTAEILATSLNVTATVYGSDSDGEFVYGVHEIADGAASANSAIIKRLYAESASASLALKDQLFASIPEDTIKGFASISAALGYIVAQHKQIKRAATPQISYSTLFRIFCGTGDPGMLSLPSDDATIAILTQKLADMPDWMWLSELSGVGAADRNVVLPNARPNKVTLNIDGQLQIIRPRTVFRGTVPESGEQFMLIVQPAERRGLSATRDSIGLVYLEQDEAAVIALVSRLLHESNPFKGRVVLINRDLRTVRSRMSDRSWKRYHAARTRPFRTRLHCRFSPQSRNAEDRADIYDVAYYCRDRRETENRPPSSASSTTFPARRPSSSSKRLSISARSITLRKCWHRPW